MSACNAFAENGAPCGDYASVCCGGYGPGGPATCVGERIEQIPLKGSGGMFKVKWTPGTCVVSATGVTGITGGAPVGASKQGSPAAAAKPGKPGQAKGGAAGGKPYAPELGSFCTRWVGEGGACTLSGADAPASGMVCCEPGLSKSYGAGARVSILTCGLKQTKGGAWVPSGCERQDA